MTTNVISVPPQSTIVIQDCVFLLKEFLSSEDRNTLGPQMVHETYPKMVAQMSFSRGWPARRDPGHRMARFGDEGVTYDYKGKPKPIHAFTPALDVVRDRIVTALGWRPNCVVVNSYSSGSGLYPHRDGAYIPQLGNAPTIVSVSFGATRTFRLHPCDPVTNKRRKGVPHVDVSLNSGDVLVMHGECDRLFHHSIPEEHASGTRVSLTFRQHAMV